MTGSEHGFEEGATGEHGERNDTATGRRRRRFLEGAAGALAVASAGCLDDAGTEAYGAVVGSETADDGVTIGLLAPDPDGDFVGRSMARSARIAVDELNDAGGIAGHEVELAVRDTNASPLEARRQYQQLVLEDDADVTVGIFDSPALLNVLDDVAEQETLHLTTGAATSAASRLVSRQYEDYRYHFRVGPTNDRDLGRGVVDFLADMAPEIGWESVAVLAEDYDWTEGPWDVYQERLEDTGVRVTLERRYPPATDDFSGLYDEVQESGADIALITTAHTGTDALRDWKVPQPRPFDFGGIHVPMQLPSYYRQTGGACRYGIGHTSATARSRNTEKTQPFVDSYREEYESNPVYTGYHTYDAVMLYAEAVESAGTFDDGELVDELESISFTGTVGTLEFYGPDHEFAHDLEYGSEQFPFFQWQENAAGVGVQEVIWPDELATAEYEAPPWLREARS
ncbi:amino acid/amide ABC transporter substrate-binding protein, HAAT family [Halobiforma haloterrestris]|uniref:Amino acid/amide ABC transporter substrate-binding protein, HAAT family n=1 Tax=Natronobacterium haloterrestre TaxID=148448 RepID=A0A1I1EBU3_NATHA|nr:ABC transporter substrate-binding protein [Halobiforma haloterrestris]SFB84206.1 amino acid/amide ABC transporter substrate-binding protein, HAAT family [Halobiforma haloterrestris]